MVTLAVYCPAYKMAGKSEGGSSYNAKYIFHHRWSRARHRALPNELQAWHQISSSEMEWVRARVLYCIQVCLELWKYLASE
jgi:hypothetical protein